MTSAIGFGIFLAVIALFALGFAASRTNKKKQSERAAYIKAYHFPATLRGKMALKYPHLSLEQLELVYRGMRQYFLACLDANVVKSGKSVGMPSKVVDELWHEFLLCSREYASFCDKAFGGFLHHTPDSSMKVPMHQALGNTLHHIKQRNNGATGIAMLAGIPLLFAIDNALAIEGGFKHDAASLAAIEAQRAAAAASSGSCGTGGGCGTSSGSGDSSGGSCSSSSCGGGGCGGGCGS
jgi:hypothetical protein